MALFSYNNYPHLWFPLGRPGGQGGNISLWAIASKHNEEQSKSIIFISSDWSRQKDKFAKFPFAPISFLSLPHLYLLPLCQPSHLSKHWGWSLPLNFINPKLLLTFTDFPNAQLGAWFTCVSENHSFKNKQFDLKQWWGKYILLLNKRRAGL